VKKSLFVTLMLTILLLAACGGSKSQATPAPESVPAEYAGKTNPFGADAAADGQKVFMANCQTCHGPEGYGDGPAGAALDPAPRNLAEFQPTAGDDYLFWRIATGRPGTAMVAWQGILKEDQIWQVIAFIRTLK
jgi:mono/diheme cytochrome c family protein